MSKRKRLALRALIGMGAFLLLLSGVAAMIPTLINLESMKERIVATICETTGCQTGFMNIKVKYFPRPHLSIHHATFAVPDRYSGTLDSMTIYPRILPLLWGNLEFGMVHFLRPQLTAGISRPKDPKPQEDGKEERRQPPFPERIEQVLLQFFGGLGAKMPGLVLRIEDGTLQLTGDRDEVFSFEDLNVVIHLPPVDLQVALNCRSNLWGDIQLSARLDPKQHAFSGRITVADFKIKPLVDFALPSMSPTITQFCANLDVSFRGELPRDLTLEIHGSLPMLELEAENHKFPLQCEALDAMIRMGAGRMEIDIHRVQMSLPEMTLSGTYSMDSNTPSATLDLEGREIDAKAVRTVALGLLGRYRTVEKIFEIIHGGRVPLITYSAWGDSPARFGKPDQYRITGSMVNGRIFVPKVELDVKEAAGEVVVERGILNGTNLRGRTIGSLGSDGTLKIGLVRRDGAPTPYHLDIGLDADLAELKPVLLRVVKNTKFLEELKDVRNVQGRATGRLLQGESLEEVATRVEVRAFQISGQYRRLPHEAHLRGEAFVFESTQVAIGPVSGWIGKSSLSGVSAVVNWGEKSELTVTTSEHASVSLVLDEIYPWVVSHDAARKLFKNIESAKGTLIADTLEIHGPLFSHRERRFHTRGQIVDVGLKVPFLPSTLLFKNGRFEATREKVSVEGASSTLLDASMNLSGSLEGYLGGMESLSITPHGIVGPQACQWILNLAHLPDRFRPRPPVSISRSRLVRAKDGSFSFVGDMSQAEGAEFSIDMQSTPERISIQHLSIKDEHSDAALQIEVSQRELDLGFSGALSNRTLDRLLEKNTILEGRVEGRFQSHIFMDELMRSTAQGELQASGFTFTHHGFPGVVAVHNAHLLADGNRLDVRSAQIKWRESNLTIQGNVEVSTDVLRLDMDASADRLSWEQLRDDSEGNHEGGTEGIQKGNGSRKGRQGAGNANANSDSSRAQIQGVVRVKAESFSLGKLTWSPLHASVNIGSEAVDVDLSQAMLCGISTPGSIRLSPQGIRLDLKPSALNQEIEHTLSCLVDKRDLIDGTFTLGGTLTTGSDTRKAAAGSLKGVLDVHAQKGRIYRLGLLNKILSVLNVTEIFVGSLPNLVDEGFAFDTIKARGNLENGKLVLSESVIDGPSMKLVWNGSVDIANWTVDLIVVIAPLRTVDRIIGNVPLIGGVLGGKLLSIPIKVSGDIDNPDVIPLSPSAVGSELLDYLKRTINLPFTLFDAFR